MSFDLIIVHLLSLAVALLLGLAAYSLGWLKCNREWTQPVLADWKHTINCWGESNTSWAGLGAECATAADAWKAVAVALMLDHAEEGTYLPTDPALLAYNHARNRRYAEALEVLT